MSGRCTQFWSSRWSNFSDVWSNDQQVVKTCDGIPQMTGDVMGSSRFCQLLIVFSNGMFLRPGGLRKFRVDIVSFLCCKKPPGTLISYDAVFWPFILQRARLAFCHMVALPVWETKSWFYIQPMKIGPSWNSNYYYVVAITIPLVQKSG